MRIGIVGSGVVGEALAKGFLARGDEVMRGTREPAKLAAFVCGNDDGAKRQAGAILDAFGWDVEDLGGAEAARAIEPLCMLWCIPGFRRNDWVHAFKLLRP